MEVFYMKLKIIGLSIAMFALLNPMEVKSQKKLDGVYTLQQIITENNEVKNFEYGGEVILNGTKITLTTPTIKEEWIVNEKNLKAIENGFEEINSVTKERFIYEKK